VWRTQTPSRAAFFEWSAALGKSQEAACYCDRRMICVIRLVSLWIIFFSTATWLLLCGALSSFVSSCPRLCPDELLLVVLWKAEECYGVKNSVYWPLLVPLERNEK
jgi:hypothetical protein